MEDDFFNELNQTTDYKISVAVNMDSMDGWFLDVITEAASSGIMLNLKAEDQAFSESMLREGKVMAAVSTNSRANSGMQYRIAWDDVLHSLCFGIVL